jgi:hypothetical protein
MKNATFKRTARIIERSSGESEISQTSQVTAEHFSFITHNEVHHGSLSWLALPGDDNKTTSIPNVILQAALFFGRLFF